jgi:hypothetical protein
MSRHPAVRAGWSGAGRIDSPDDVHRILAAVNAAGAARATTTELRRPAYQAAEVAERGGTGQLPVHPLLSPLLPWRGGLLRGATITATGATSLLLALLAGAMSTGGYGAVVGLPALGAVAAVEHGIALVRLALVPVPGPDWPTVTAALLDGLDMVVVAVAGPVAAGVARSLSARARARGAVLVTTAPWPGADLALTATGHRWAGLGHGRGRLRQHEMTIAAIGRGQAARRREVTVPVPLLAPQPPTAPRHLRPVEPVEHLGAARSA